MIHDSFLDRHIGELLRAADEAKSAKHVPSGRLSASSLGDPLQWQILRAMGVPTEPIDDYTLRKFKRGNDVEEWYLTTIPDVLARQEEVLYRGVVGYLDSMVETAQWEFPSGKLPLEVKSVSNAKFKRIEAQGADDNHKLQCGLYGLAKEAENFAISYIATDDYRVKTFIFKTEDFAKEINQIIARFDKQRATGKVPAFEPVQKWQANAKYNRYPQFSELSAEAATELAHELATIK